MTEKEQDELLIEAAAGAWRPESTDSVGAHPAWHDLDAEGRQEAFAVATTSRRMEAALDPRGYNSTVLAVLRRIRSASQ